MQPAWLRNWILFLMFYFEIHSDIQQSYRWYRVLIHPSPVSSKCERLMYPRHTSIKSKKPGFLCGPVVKLSHCHCKGRRFDPWSGNWEPVCCAARLKIKTENNRTGLIWASTSFFFFFSLMPFSNPFQDCIQWYPLLVSTLWQFLSLARFSWLSHFWRGQGICRTSHSLQCGCVWYFFRRTLGLWTWGKSPPKVRGCPSHHDTSGASKNPAWRCLCHYRWNWPCPLVLGRCPPCLSSSGLLSFSSRLCD